MKLTKSNGGFPLVMLMMILILVVDGTLVTSRTEAYQHSHANTRETELISYVFAQTNDGYMAYNPAHELSIQSTVQTIEVGFQGHTWQLYSHDVPHSISAANNQLIYHYADYDAWYINSPNGLQQGFTLSEPVDIQFDINGTLNTILDGDRLSLVNDSNSTILTYTGLMAWDARHVDVPVTMSLENGRLGFVVDDTDAVYPVTIDPWLSEYKIVPADNVTDDGFGWSVALSGDTALIGAPGDDDNGYSSGSAYVYTFSGANWTQQAKLLASDGAIGNDLGVAVALDGDTALVAAPDANGGATASGAVYVFVRSGTAWTQQAKLIASDALGASSFGSSVALQGDMAIIGDRYDAENGLDSGSVYIFMRTGSNWYQQQKITGPDGVDGQFGSDLSVNGDDLLIGAPYAKAAYLYAFNGAMWSFQHKLMPNYPNSLDRFGLSVEVVDGTIMVAAEKWGPDNRGSTETYWVNVFEGTGSNWSQVGIIDNPSGASTNDGFGYEIEIAGDIALIGAAGPVLANAPGDGGRVHVYKNLKGYGWTLVDTLQASDKGPYDIFGSDVAFDGTRVVIGAIYQGVGGAAYIRDAQFITLAAGAACNGPNLEVTITDPTGPFDITASAGINLPLLGVSTGMYTVNGPEKWDDVTVTRSNDYMASVYLGQLKCRTDDRPTLYWPNHRAYTTNRHPTFIWSAIADANNYRLFVFDDSVAANRTVDVRENSGGATTYIVQQQLPLGRLFWRVRARVNRVWGLWSVRFTLFIDPVAPIMTLGTPIPDAIVPSTPIIPPNQRDPVTPVPSPVEPTATLPSPPNSR